MIGRMKSVTATAGEWTELHTSDTSYADVIVQCTTPGVDIAVRLGGASSDDLTAAHVVIASMERVPFHGIWSGEPIYVRPTAKRPGTVAIVY